MYLRSSMTASTRSLVARLTTPGLRMTLETVAVETLASLAMSMMVKLGMIVSPGPPEARVLADIG
jgi:hypothetical protein